MASADEDNSVTITDPLNEIYEVEFVVDKGLGDDDGPLYKIRWTGYDESVDTWEPLENLTDAMDAVHEYEKAIRRSRSRKYEKKKLSGIKKSPKVTSSQKYVPSPKGDDAHTLQKATQSLHKVPKKNSQLAEKGNSANKVCTLSAVKGTVLFLKAFVSEEPGKAAEMRYVAEDKDGQPIVMGYKDAFEVAPSELATFLHGQLKAHLVSGKN
ncbi:chromo domain containing protein [Aphelenchoides avenae]|nr:chromo domain containing protein [Aphelenchus avenae]